MNTITGKIPNVYAPGGGSSSAGGGVSNVSTLAELAAIQTTNKSVPYVILWVQESDGTSETWRLLASTAATGDGIQRPDDYNASTNAKVWFKASS